MKLSQTLFVAFLCLKLMHYINWSWFWIFSPLLMGLIISLITSFLIKKEREEMFMTILGFKR